LLRLVNIIFGQTVDGLLEKTMRVDAPKELMLPFQRTQPLFFISFVVENEITLDSTFGYQMAFTSNIKVTIILTGAK
jgi:hypothetical protein